MSSQKRRWGDRRDAKKVRDITGLQVIMGHLWPNRTDCEVYLNDKIDVTNLMKYLAEKNAGKQDRKVTIFHCFITAVARMFRERPYLNRFIQGHCMYEHNEVSLSFVAKRQFKDGAEESLLFLVPKDSDTVNEISDFILGRVDEIRNENKISSIDNVLDQFAKIPRLLLMLVIRIIRWLDFWGWVPKPLTEGDTHYSSVLLSNLGSIQCPSVYHHLSNYGTNSCIITIGTVHKEKVLMEDGSEEIRDIMDIGVTIDERIADGFYFARSLKLIKYIFNNPELLEEPIGEPTNFEYK